MAPHRFPLPWTAEEHDTCFIVKDHTGLNWPTCTLKLSPTAGRRQSCCLVAKPAASKFAKLPQWLDE
jgi:hypothetical protein